MLPDALRYSAQAQIKNPMQARGFSFTAQAER